MFKFVRKHSQPIGDHPLWPCPLRLVIKQFGPPLIWACCVTEPCCSFAAMGSLICTCLFTYSLTQFNDMIRLTYAQYVNWLVVWNIWIIFHILGMSSSQLTNSYFLEGWAQPPSSHSFSSLLFKVTVHFGITSSYLPHLLQLSSFGRAMSATTGHITPFTRQITLCHTHV